MQYLSLKHKKDIEAEKYKFWSKKIYTWNLEETLKIEVLSVLLRDVRNKG